MDTAVQHAVYRFSLNRLGEHFGHANLQVLQQIATKQSVGGASLFPVCGIHRFV